MPGIIDICTPIRQPEKALLIGLEREGFPPHLQGGLAGYAVTA